MNEDELVRANLGAVDQVVAGFRHRLPAHVNADDLRSAAHLHLGFGSFVQYIERLFGYKARTIQEKLRVAEALEVLPQLAGALEAGTLGWCAARELTRVVVPETEQAWLETTRGKTQRELEALVASHAPGDPPDAPPRGVARRHVLRFEVAPENVRDLPRGDARNAPPVGWQLERRRPLARDGPPRARRPSRRRPRQLSHLSPGLRSLRRRCAVRGG